MEVLPSSEFKTANENSKTTWSVYYDNKEDMLVVESSEVIEFEDENEFWEILAEAVDNYVFEYEVAHCTVDGIDEWDVRQLSPSKICIKLRFSPYSSFPSNVFEMPDFIHDLSYNLGYHILGGDIPNYELEDAVALTLEVDECEISVEDNVKPEVVFRLLIDARVELI